MTFKCLLLVCLILICSCQKSKRESQESASDSASVDEEKSSPFVATSAADAAEAAPGQLMDQEALNFLRGQLAKVMGDQAEKVELALTQHKLVLGTGSPEGVKQLQLGSSKPSPLQKRSVLYEASMGALPSPAEIAVNIAALSEEDSAEADVLLGEYAYLGMHPGGITAYTFFKRGADRGSPQGHRWLAFLHLTGRVTPHADMRKVLIHLTMAIRGGDHWAAMMLASLHRHGTSVIQSCDADRHLSRLAASRVLEEIKKTSIRSPHRNRRLVSDEDSHRRERDIVHYYEYAANTGDVNAQVAVANIYLQGDYGLRRNMDRAFKYYQLAAQQGDKRGIAMVGFMFDNGYGVEQDNETALAFYNEAAELEDGAALTRLGRAYQEGRLGLQINHVLAQEYFNRAIKVGNGDAFEALGLHSFHGWASKRDHKRARQLFTAASHKGSTRGTLQLADMTASCSQAVSLLRRVNERSDVGVLMHTAYVQFSKGNKLLAALLYEVGARMGIESAQSNAAYAYHWLAEEPLRDSHMKQVYYSRASSYFVLSARQAMPESHLMLAEYYFHGKGVDKSHEMAVQAYRQAADMSNAHAMFQLGYMYHQGLGVPVPDPHLAKRYYDMALKRNPAAIYAWAVSLVLLFASSGWEFLWETLQLSAPSANIADMRVLGASADSILIAFCVFSLVTLLLIRRAMA